MSNKILMNVLIVLVVGVALFAGYLYFTGSDEQSQSGVSVVGGNQNIISSASEAAEFVILLDNLKNVDLSSSIFSNRAFSVDLQDFTTPLPNRPTGRSNPFAPLGSGNLSTSN